MNEQQPVQEEEEDEGEEEEVVPVVPEEGDAVKKRASSNHDSSNQSSAIRISCSHKTASTPTTTGEPKQKKKRGRGGGCYHCGSCDHRGKFCPTTRCLYCHQVGHDIGGCPVKRKEQQQEEVRVDFGQFKQGAAASSSSATSATFTFVELFAGIGGFRIALEKLGGACVWASESERKFVVPNYQLNFGGDRPAGDIALISSEKIPDHDVLVGGFPCQSFTSSGKRLGLEDETRGQLYKEIVRVLRTKQPKSFVLENVRGLLLHNNGATFATIRTELKACGYEMVYEIMDAVTILPQERKRLFMIGIRNDLTNKPEATTPCYQFPELPRLHRGVHSILEENLQPQQLESLELSRHQINKVWNQSYTQKYPEARFLSDLTQPTKTLQSSYASYMVNSQFIPVTTATTTTNTTTSELSINQQRWRKFSPREAARLQGFPESFQLCPARSYHMLGNAVPPPLVALIVAPLLQRIGIDIDIPAATTTTIDDGGKNRLRLPTNTAPISISPATEMQQKQQDPNDKDYTSTPTTNGNGRSTIIGWNIAKEMLLEASPTDSNNHRREKLQRVLDQVG